MARTVVYVLGLAQLLAIPAIHAEAESLIAAQPRECWPYKWGCPPAPPPLHCEPTTNDRHISVSANRFNDMVDWGLVNLTRNIMQDLCPSYPGRGALRCAVGGAANGRSLALTYCEAKSLVIDFGFATNGCYVMYQKWPNGGLAVDCPSIAPAATAESKASCGFSWGSELTDIVPLEGGYPPADCDLHISEPTLLIKTDFPHHIYHHFTSIFNVWLSLHVAGLPTDGSIRLVFVDKFMHRKTESESHDTWLGTFTEAWYPFTRFPILDRRQLGPSSGVRGKKVCFDQAVLTSPPRASFFYPTRGVGCSPSHMMTAFVDWMLRNMTLANIQPPPASRAVVVTLIKRRGARVNTRVMLNQKQLLRQLRERYTGLLDVRVLDFEGMSFRAQIEAVRQSHILAGMHGAGLTHVLWLARQQYRVALVEIYNTKDEFCYKDLAALAGVRYFTWVADEAALNPEGGISVSPTNAKHVNYSPDPVAFLTLMSRAIDYVRGTGELGSVEHSDL